MSAPTIAPPSPSLGARVQARLAFLVGQPLFWFAFVSIVMGFPILRSVRAKLPARLPVLGTLRSFTLTDQNGRPFGSEQLSGRVWVADFIFTRCPTVCPLITSKMAKIQHRARNLGEAFHLVTFSVDPEHDTPGRLSEYARRYRASPRMWSFLTGSFDDVRRTVVEGLKISMGRVAPDSDFASIFHGTHFVLVDDKLRIRGYYDSTDASAIDRLLRDAGLIANRGG